MTRRLVSCRCGVEFVATGRRAAAVAPGGGRLDRCGSCRRLNAMARGAARVRAHRSVCNAQCAAETSPGPLEALSGRRNGLS